MAMVGAAKVVTPSFSDRVMHSMEGAPGVTTFRTTAPYQENSRHQELGYVGLAEHGDRNPG